MIHIQPIPGEQPSPYDLLILADPDREKIDQYLPGSEIFAAYENDHLIGICLLKKQGPFHFEIMNIAVDRAYQGKGIGKLLLQYAIDQAREAGGTFIRIATGNSSTGQIALYQKAGFVIVEVIKDYFVDNYPDPIWENGVQCKDRVIMKLAL